MFQRLRSLDATFRILRTFTLCVIAGSLALGAFALYLSHRLITESRQRVYVLAAGQALEAYAAGQKEQLAIETRDHVKTFHQHFFTLDPDEKLIQANLRQAFYLADGSAKQAYDNLKESGYYAGVVAGNISQRIEVDSISVNTAQHPYSFRCVATQRLIRSSHTVRRRLVTQGRLRSVGRSEHNPHGFLIERWTTLENRDIRP